MYFYEIEVNHSLLDNEKIIMRHDDCFNNHQLNSIVQEAFDECIEKYCNKPLLEDGEEACKMEVETIFKEYLPLQLKNHGFSSIKINETCSIMNEELFVGKGARNNVLKNRYKDKVLPPCKKCIRDECIVPNIRKNSVRCYIKPYLVQFDENEEERDSETDFNVEIIKLYFNTSKKYKVPKKIREAVSEIIFNNNLQNFWVHVCDSDDSLYHVGDVLCSFYNSGDEKKLKKIFANYGFLIEDSQHGFWITGVKE